MKRITALNSFSAAFRKMFQTTTSCVTCDAAACSLSLSFSEKAHQTLTLHLHALVPQFSRGGALSRVFFFFTPKSKINVVFAAYIERETRAAACGK